MSTQLVEEAREITNPLDAIEDMVAANEWPFERAGAEQLVIEVTGTWCDYNLFFVWLGEYAALQFCCQWDVRIPAERQRDVNDLLAAINERLLMGHMAVAAEDQTPIFRQTVILRGVGGIAPEQVEDLVNVSLTECERYYPAFQHVLWGGKTAAEALEAAILDTQGEA